MIDFNDVQVGKTQPSILVRELGNVTLSSEVQPSNAYLPILVTEFGIVTVFTDVQFSKALFSIEVTLLPSIVDGISTLETEPKYFSIHTVPFVPTKYS